jgi:hypothetical protein
MRRLCIVGMILVLPVALAACRQASSAWQSTKACVGSVLPNSCEKDECGRVLTDPVYDSCSASEARVGGPLDHRP